MPVFFEIEKQKYTAVIDLSGCQMQQEGILHSENGGYLLFLACISLVQKFYHSSAKFASGKTEIHSRSVRISTISADFSSCAG